MKLVNYQLKGNEQQRIGFIIDDYVYDVQKSYQLYSQHQGTIGQAEEIPSDPAFFFSLGNRVIQQVEAAYRYFREQPTPDWAFQRSKVRLGAPNPSPEKIICVGLNYSDHADEMNSDVSPYPVIFAKFPNALIGPEDMIQKSPLTNKLDYEVELVVMIGKEASMVKQQDAYDYIAGFTIGNDISARDLQKRTPQWLQGKTLDNSTPIGPWIVTKEELANPDQLNVRSYVNGELRQQSNTKYFIFDIPYLIEFISHIMTLKPGDLIFTGTPAGVGMGMEPQQFLHDGDIVRLEIEGIGLLENKVVDQQSVTD